MRRAIRDFAPLNESESTPAYDLLNLTAGGLCYGDLIAAVGLGVGACNTASSEMHCEVQRSRRGGLCSKGDGTQCGGEIADWAQHRIAT